MDKEINHKDLLEHGTIVTDKEYAQDNQYIRICKIKYQNVIYHVRIENDKITAFVTRGTIGFIYVQWQGSGAERRSEAGILAVCI